MTPKSKRIAVKAAPMAQHAVTVVLLLAASLGAAVNLSNAFGIKTKFGAPSPFDNGACDARVLNRGQFPQARLRAKLYLSDQTTKWWYFADPSEMSTRQKWAAWRDLLWEEKLFVERDPSALHDAVRFIARQNLEPSRRIIRISIEAVNPHALLYSEEINPENLL